MFVLFSSNAESLFQRGILEAVSLPSDCPRTFRYQSKYVSPDILECLQKKQVRNFLKTNGNRALIVYAERPSDQSAPPGSYRYCPTRLATVESLRLMGDIVFLELRFREFPNFSNWAHYPKGQTDFNAWLVDRHGAITPNGQGCFCCTLPDGDPWCLSGGDQTDGSLWQNVVDRLAQMPSMDNCLFYQVRGFFYPRNSWFRGNSMSEKPIPPRLTPGALTYPIKMSRAVDLKFLFYRPSSAKPKTIKATLSIDADKSGFSEVPTRELLLESRYDELTLRLVTKRVFDNTLAPVSIRLKDQNSNVLACEPVLLCSVNVPPSLLALLLACFCIAPTLLATSAADFNWLLSHVAAYSTETGAAKAAALSSRLAAYAKVGGGLFTALGAYIAFRRFPLK